MVAAPLFSVLMPTHSRVDVIEYSIRSILNQTVTDFELLVVGDGCAPGTADVVQRFGDPRIRFFDLPKAPHFGYANRNVALSRSRGRFIAFMADDDLVLPDHLALLQESLEGGSALAYTQAVWVSTDGVAAPFLTNLEFEDELEIFVHKANSIPASCFAYRADVLPTRAAWPEDVPSGADWKLWHRIIDAVTEDALTYCRVPTVLHFSATWKQSRNSGMPQLATLLDIADDAPWWPRALKPEIPPAKTEQSIYAALLASPSWPETFRVGVADVVGRIAWDDIGSTRPELLSNRIRSEQLDRLGEEIARQNAQIAALAREIEQLSTSRSWKLTKPLRHLAAFLRKRRNSLRCVR